jgi:hypothetical protein
MQALNIILEISLWVNVALISLLLFTVYNKAIAWYKKRSKSRETRKVSQIRKIVRDYLKELQK